MATKADYYYPSADGIHNIHAVKWTPDSEAKAILQFTHGIGENTDSYTETAEYMCSRGFIVVGIDLLGHGLSYTDEKDAGFFAKRNSWKILLADVHKLYETEHSALPHLPYFLLGHSMGSFISRTYIMRYDTPLAGCIFTGSTHNSPATFTSGSTLAGIAAAILGPRHRSERINHMTYGKFSPHFGPNNDIPASLGMTRDVFGGMAYMVKQKNIDRTTKDIPILFFSGLKDSVNHKGRDLYRAKEAMENAGCKDITVKLHPEGHHNLLRGNVKEDVWQGIAQWMEEKITAK